MENKIVVRPNIRFNRFIAKLHNQVAEMTLFLKIFVRIVSKSKFGGEEELNIFQALLLYCFALHFLSLDLNFYMFMIDLIYFLEYA